MPIVKIDIWKGRTREQKEVLIKAIYKAFGEAIPEIAKEHIAVIINEVEKENWGLRGEQASKIRPD